jgi:hypothetical protein
LVVYKDYGTNQIRKWEEVSWSIIYAREHNVKELFYYKVFLFKNGTHLVEVLRRAVFRRYCTEIQAERQALKIIRNYSSPTHHCEEMPDATHYKLSAIKITIIRETKNKSREGFALAAFDD